MTRDSKLTTNKNISWYVITRTILGDYCGGAPPLPIPNREVKPASADGTAFICGRVGRRQSLPKAPVLFEPGPFLFLLNLSLFRGVVYCFENAKPPQTMRLVAINQDNGHFLYHFHIL